MRYALFLLAAFELSGCTTFPDVPLPEGGVDATADYPEFVPMRRVAMQEAEAETRNAETEEQLEARVASLRARAARLRSATLD